MKALIICLISGEYTLYDKDTKETFIAKPRGVFRNKKSFGLVKFSVAFKWR